MSMTSRRMNWASAPTQNNEADRYPRARHLGTSRAGADGLRAAKTRAAGPRAVLFFVYSIFFALTFAGVIVYAALQL